MGGVDNKLHDYCIGIAKSDAYVEKLIKICDDSFSEPLLQRPGYQETLKKIEYFANVFVAYNSDILGYLAVYVNDVLGKVAYITMFAVKDKHQQEGIGTCLLETAVNFCMDRHMKCIRLEVHNDNIQGIRFYERCGLIKLGIASPTSFYMGKDLL